MRSALQRHAPFVAIFAVAVVLRLVDLARVPNPAGDEGTWTWIAFRIAHGTPAGLDADASFVSLTHARLMALSMRLVGEGFFAARLVGVVASLVAVIAIYVAYATRDARRAGLVGAAFIAYHPWAILWPRTASVPYALALCVLTVGQLLFVSGLVRKNAWLVAAGIVVFALGPDFSPLTFLPAMACGLFALRPAYRWLFRRPALYAGLGLAAVHAVPIVLAASRVARATAPRHHFDHFATRLASYLHLTLTGTMGEATLRHFTDAAFAPALAAPLAIATVATVALGARDDVRDESPFAGFGPFAFVFTLATMPFLLAPGRPWHLARIDTDRYLFALIPSFAMCLGDLAHAAWEERQPFVLSKPQRGDEAPLSKLQRGTSATVSKGVAVSKDGAYARMAVAIALAIPAIATIRGAVWFARGGGPDRGLGVFDGGGDYRGWRVARESEPLPVLLRDEVLRQVGRDGAAMIIADMAFHPLHVTNALVGIPVFDMRRGPVPARPDGHYFYVIWADTIFAPAMSPDTPARENRALRAHMLASSPHPQLVRRFVQPDGSPLCELWRADR